MLFPLVPALVCAWIGAEATGKFKFQKTNDLLFRAGFLCLKKAFWEAGDLRIIIPFLERRRLRVRRKKCFAKKKKKGKKT